jgi:hypothetical protein
MVVSLPHFFAIEGKPMSTGFRELLISPTDKKAQEALYKNLTQSLPNLHKSFNSL